MSLQVRNVAPRHLGRTKHTGKLLFCAVYLLDELAQIAKGGGEEAQGLADATVKRLGNRSPIVKQKVSEHIH